MFIALLVAWSDQETNASKQLAPQRIVWMASSNRGCEYCSGTPSAVDTASVAQCFDGLSYIHFLINHTSAT